MRRQGTERVAVTPLRYRAKKKAKRKMREGPAVTHPTVADVQMDWPICCPTCGNTATFRMKPSEIRSRAFRCRCGHALAPWE
jgi:predicted RNA-binding Zn-ribbon protein involved in translation (DUF1610 family)